MFIEKNNLYCYWLKRKNIHDKMKFLRIRYINMRVIQQNEYVTE